MFSRRVLGVFLTQVLTFALAFFANILIARALGPTDMGKYSLVVTFASFVALVGGIGIPEATVFYLNDSSKSIQHIIPSSFLLQIGLVSILVAGMGYVAPWLVDSVVFDGEIPAKLLFIAIALLTPLTALSSLLSNLFLGLNLTNRFNYMRIAVAGAKLILVVLLLLLAQMQVVGGILASTFSLVLACAMGLFWLHGLGLKLVSGFSKSWCVSLLKYGVRGWPGSILQYFNYRFDGFIVNAFLGAALVGQYSVAVAMAEMIWFIPAAISTVLFPRTSADQNVATAFTPVVSRVTFLVTLVAAAILGALSIPLVRILYGNQYVLTISPLLALLPGVVALSVGKVIASDLAGRNKPQYGTLSALSGLLVTLALDLVLIPTMGIVGAAIASTLSYVLSSAILVYLYLKISENTLTSILVPRWDDVRKVLAAARRMRSNPEVSPT